MRLILSSRPKIKSFKLLIKEFLEGLFIYAREDVPIADQTEAPDNPLMLIAEEVTVLIKLGNIKSAHERCEGLNQTDKLGVWSLLNAKTKLALKRYLEA